MKRLAIVPAIFLLQAISGLAQVFSPPSGFPIERYAGILEKSPFSQATLLQEAPASDSFAKDLVLVSHYRYGGVLYLNLQDRGTQKRLLVTSTAPADSMRAVSLNTDSNPWKVSAVIELNGQKATVGFDPPNFPKPSAPAVAAAQQNRPSLEPVQRTRIRSAQDD